MTKKMLSLLSIACAVSLVNARRLEAAKASQTINARDLATYLIKHGDSATKELGKNSAMLGFPTTRQVSVRGDSTDPGEVGKDKFADCDVVVENQNGVLVPVCLIVTKENLFPAQRKSISEEYRFALDGSLEKAVHVETALDAKGEGVPGSSVDKALPLNRDTMKAAKATLDIWLKRVAKKLAEKNAAAKTPDPKSQRP